MRGSISNCQRGRQSNSQARIIERCSRTARSLVVFWFPFPSKALSGIVLLCAQITKICRTAAPAKAVLRKASHPPPGDFRLFGVRLRESGQ